MLSLKELFLKHDKEYHKFDRVLNKRHPAADIHVFLLLYELCPPKNPGVISGIISAVGYEEFWIATDAEEFAEKATEEHVIELIRCGVRYSEGGFCMWA